MPSKKSIIFELNNSLRVYTVGLSVNQGISGLQLVRVLDREEKGLELSSKFEFLWQDIEESGLMKGVDEMFFLIGKNAGFTDTRIVFVWLKTWKMFDTIKTFYLKKIDIDTPIDFLELDLLNDLLNQAKIENNHISLSYSHEPKIGKSQ